jgi:hypothetical protein
MDFLAHGLWGGATFGRKSKTSWRWAFFWGMAPDLFAFGPAILAGIITGNYFAWANYPQDGIPRSAISAYSYNAYHVTHSLVVWTWIAAVIWMWKGRFSWRAAIFPDSVSLAASDAPARWHSLGKSTLHAGQLRFDRRNVRYSKIPSHPLKCGDRGDCPL